MNTKIIKILLQVLILSILTCTQSYGEDRFFYKGADKETQESIMKERKEKVDALEVAIYKRKQELKQIDPSDTEARIKITNLIDSMTSVRDTLGTPIAVEVTSSGSSDADTTTTIDMAIIKKDDKALDEILKLEKDAPIYVEAPEVEVKAVEEEAIIEEAIEEAIEEVIEEVEAIREEVIDEVISDEVISDEAEGINPINPMPTI